MQLAQPLKERYRAVFTPERRRSLAVAGLILALSIIFQYYASLYATLRGTQFVGDIFLDNLPIVNLNLIIVEGALVAILMSIIVILLKPRYIIFTVKAVAVFLAFRAFFVAVTHLGIYPGQVVPGAGFFDQIYVAFGMESGYFFSAHTGLPFFMALIFWRDRFWRYIYLATSALFGVSVLLSHVHYSIDVFAAPFMAYSIFKLSEYLFKRDHQIIFNG